MSDAGSNNCSTPYPVKKFDGGMAYCVCCKTTLSANKSVFGVSPWFPLTPPDHFCKECAEALEVVVYNWPPDSK